METSFSHLPVLPEETLAILSPTPGKKALDCTFGLGGHSLKILEKILPGGLLIGVDRDEEILSVAAKKIREESPARSEFVRFFCTDYAEIKDVLGARGLLPVDLLLADLGVNSVHLETMDRGFSFRLGGPLDMRFDRSDGETALALLRRKGDEEIAEILFRFGEERYARRIAGAIKRELEAGRLLTTGELATLCERSYPPDWRRAQKVHPATRTFQAIRIAVNGELDSLVRLLDTLPELLAKGGRAAIISFHSLEDRLVKQSFRAGVQNNLYRDLTRKPLLAGERERAENPRARSAKLRAVERL